MSARKNNPKNQHQDENFYLSKQDIIPPKLLISEEYLKTTKSQLSDDKTFKPLRVGVEISDEDASSNSKSVKNEANVQRGQQKLTTTASLDPLPPSTKAKTDDDCSSLTLLLFMLGVAWVMYELNVGERLYMLNGYSCYTGQTVFSICRSYIGHI